MTDTALIQSFISFDLASVLISHSHQKQPSLSTIYGNLPDNLIEALIIKLLSDRTDADLFRLFLQ